ncbi:hypothetical protein B0H14DRAFT_2702886 [Mycena olivaceomarginata]|nr:hypothetical protein B0H14DRAFT_2702886 [Mycena olivaceomarginata]
MPRVRKEQNANAASRTKSGCYTCRICRKKCDERMNLNHSCETCARLKLECLGFGPKLPEWLREKNSAAQVKNKIKDHTSSRRIAQQDSTELCILRPEEFDLDVGPTSITLPEEQGGVSSVGRTTSDAWSVFCGEAAHSFAHAHAQVHEEHVHCSQRKQNFNGATDSPSSQDTTFVWKLEAVPFPAIQQSHWHSETQQPGQERERPHAIVQVVMPYLHHPQPQGPFHFYFNFH